MSLSPCPPFLPFFAQRAVPSLPSPKGLPLRGKRSEKNYFAQRAVPSRRSSSFRFACFACFALRSKPFFARRATRCEEGGQPFGLASQSEAKRRRATRCEEGGQPFGRNRGLLRFACFFLSLRFPLWGTASLFERKRAKKEDVPSIAQRASLREPLRGKRSEKN